MKRILIILFLVAFILLRLEACENRAGTKAGNKSLKPEAAIVPSGIIHVTSKFKQDWVELHQQKV